MTNPVLIPRAEHCISRDNIDDNALKVLYRLQRAGFRALLVGGSVRDLLLQHVPKDFDIATDAHPEQVKRLFGNCRLIGRRFRLAHVFYGRDIVEVATFRGSQDGQDEDDEISIDHVQSDSGRILRDNVYGSIEDDAWRRDFTVNALYYDIADFSVVDYVGAMDDIKHRVLRLIGEPATRYREDPVRMLRAVRFAAKLGFTIHPASEQPIYELAHLLADIPPARLYDEILKLFHSGYAVTCLDLLRKYGLLKYLFAQTSQALDDDPQGIFSAFLREALHSTDVRVHEDKPITPAFLFSAMLWRPMMRQYERDVQAGQEVAAAMHEAMSDVLHKQCMTVSIPRRFSMVVREIWSLQHRFAYRHGKRVQILLQHHKFRAAYDFMCLRSRAGELTDDSCAWWTALQVAPPDVQEKMLQQPADSAEKKPRKRRRRKKPASEPGV
jgi:poly(A) polymerase